MLARIGLGGSRTTAITTEGISRNLATPYAAQNESGGGDREGTGANSILHGHAGTAGSRFAVPRSLQFQSSGGQPLPDYVTEAPATGAIYARNGLLQAWELLAGTPSSIPVVGTGWAANQFLNWRLVDGGASIQISGVLARAANNNIGPGAGNNVILCTMPLMPQSQQMQVCAALAQTGLGSLPGDQIEYGYLLFGTNGALAFYGHARNDDPPAHSGTQVIYVSNTFPLTMPGAAEFILPEPAPPIFRGGSNGKISFLERLRNWWSALP